MKSRINQTLSWIASSWGSSRTVVSCPITWEVPINYNPKGENPSSYAESDYVGTLLRDATGSHLLETVIEHAPEKVVGKLWDTYIVGKLSRLAIHPVANFVVAAGFGRLEGERFASSTEEMSRVVSKCLSKCFRISERSPILLHRATTHRSHHCDG